MSSLRSSVRPKSSKQPWGTIMEPEFGLGHQKMTDYEIDQTVDRLYRVPNPRQPVYYRPQQRELGRIGIQNMIERLTREAGRKAADSNRTQKNSIYKNMGVVNSYAWKGYN